MPHRTLAVALSEIVLLLSAMQPGAKRAPRLYDVPASIAADCSADVTTALLDWFASVPDSSTLRFGRNACYDVDGGLVVDDRHALTFDGNGATFRVVSRGGYQRSDWTFRGGSDITLRNMTVRGANPSAGTGRAAFARRLQWQHGFRLSGVQGAVLDSVQVYDVYGDFVCLSNDERARRGGEPNRHVTIRDSRFERNGRMGISITHGEDVTIEDNYLGDVRWSAIDLELDDDVEVGRDLVVRRNRFGPVFHAVLANGGAGTSESVARVTFAENVMEADPLTCVPPIAVGTDTRERFWSRYVIERNELRAAGRAIDVTRVRDLTIRGNTLRFTRGGCGQREGVRVVNSHGGVVSGNTLRSLPAAFPVVRVDSSSTGIAVVGNVRK